MSATIIGVLLGAALFVLFGLVPYKGCTGHCAGCTGACGRHEPEDHHG